MSTAIISACDHGSGADWYCEKCMGVQQQSQNRNMYFAGDFGMEATSDRVLIVEDDFRSGYECEACNEVGSLVCPGCDGSGTSRVVVGAACSMCHGDKKITCESCKGKGVLLEIPQASKRRPTTGIIVSVGWEVKNFAIGDFALFPNYCGEVYDLSGVNSDGQELTVVLRMLKEREIIARITGHLKLRRLNMHKSEVTG
jgi:hypothetical protein